MHHFLVKWSNQFKIFQGKEIIFGRPWFKTSPRSWDKIDTRVKFPIPKERGRVVPVLHSVMIHYWDSGLASLPLPQVTSISCTEQLFWRQQFHEFLTKILFFFREITVFCVHKRASFLHQQVSDFNSVYSMIFFRKMLLVWNHDFGIILGCRM